VQKPISKILLASCLLLAGSACARSAPSAASAASWTGTPQAFVEKHLVASMPWEKSQQTPYGLGFDARLVGSRSHDLKAPREVLRVLCEGKGGALALEAASEKSAVALVQGIFPAKEQQQVAEAERDGAFGDFSCGSSGGKQWVARIEPLSARGPDRGEQYTWHLMMYVLAEPPVTD
jgi:hypothetical protein